MEFSDAETEEKSSQLDFAEFGKERIGIWLLGLHI